MEAQNMESDSAIFNSLGAFAQEYYPAGSKKLAIPA